MSSSLKSIRVQLVDDHELIRVGLRKLFEPESDIEVVAEAATGEAAIEAASRHRPDVILMDINLKKSTNGLEATRTILAHHPGIAIIMLTVYDENQYVIEAVKSGAVGYLQKEVDGEVILDAVRRAANGETLIDEKLSERVMDNLSETEKRLQSLTKRESEILAAIAKGRSNKEISADLSISEGTIKNHITAIFRKLEVADRTQAAILAIRDVRR